MSGQFFTEQQARAAVLERGTILVGQSCGAHLVAYLSDQGVVLSLAFDHKENEIVVIPKLLEQLDLAGVVVAGNVLQVQRELSVQVVEAKGDNHSFVSKGLVIGADAHEVMVKLDTSVAGCPCSFYPANNVPNAFTAIVGAAALRERAGGRRGRGRANPRPRRPRPTVPEC